MNIIVGMVISLIGYISISKRKIKGRNLIYAKKYNKTECSFNKIITVRKNVCYNYAWAILTLLNICNCLNR